MEYRWRDFGCLVVVGRGILGGDILEFILLVVIGLFELEIVGELGFWLGRGEMGRIMIDIGVMN